LFSRQYGLDEKEGIVIWLDESVEVIVKD